jgi:hypothetical protein
MFSNLKFYSFNGFRQILLLAGLNSLHPAVASPSFGQPIIAASVTDCEKNYLVQIYESGRVEYRGVNGVKTLGRRESQISQPALEALIKKFDEFGFTSDNRVDLPSLHSSRGPLESIRLRHGDQEMTFFSTQITPRPLLAKLRSEIIRTTKVDQWLDTPDQVSCREKTYIPISYLKSNP